VRVASTLTVVMCCALIAGCSSSKSEDMAMANRAEEQAAAKSENGDYERGEAEQTVAAPNSAAATTQPMPAGAKSAGDRGRFANPSAASTPAPVARPMSPPPPPAVVNKPSPKPTFEVTEKSKEEGKARRDAKPRKRKKRKPRPKSRKTGLAMDGGSGGTLGGLGMRGSGRGGGGVADSFGSGVAAGGPGADTWNGAMAGKGKKSGSTRGPRPVTKSADKSRTTALLKVLGSDGKSGAVAHAFKGDANGEGLNKAFADVDTPADVADETVVLEDKEKTGEDDRTSFTLDANQKNLQQPLQPMAGESAPEPDFDQTESTDLPDSERFREPETFLPRMFYFDPTYLGGNAAAMERRRRLEQALIGAPFDAARIYEQRFDPPTDAGMGLTVRLDRNYVDRPSRVFLEVGLQGSKRFGWRRPPLDMIVVASPHAWNNRRADVEQAMEQLMRRLGPADRLGLIVAGLGRPTVQAPKRVRMLRRELAMSLEKLGPAAKSNARMGKLSDAMNLAATTLADVAASEAAIPGTQTVLLLADHADRSFVAEAERAAHQLTSTNAVFTSVVELSGDARWWDVAAKGYGNYHRLGRANLAKVVDDELGSLSRVVARLLRLNVRLGPHTKAVRVVGTRKLTEEEVKQVKAREVAIDVQLSKAQGVKADRGDDDDGVQTVIPYFYGGDAHVVLIELWVERAGPVADVTLKYKDMVNLGNATARASAAIDSRPRGVTPEQREVAKNLRGARIAEHLKVAGQWMHRNNIANARAELQQAMALVPSGESQETMMLRRFQNMLFGPQRDRVADALTLAGERKLGASR